MCTNNDVDDHNKEKLKCMNIAGERSCKIIAIY